MDLKNLITQSIIELQDENGCWNVLSKYDKHYPEFNYYIPKYKSTLWTLIFLADIKCNFRNKKFIKPLTTISSHFLNKEFNIFTLGNTHFPIPCLNGNMLYLYSYFQFGNNDLISDIVDFFAQYQRFDDGDFKTPKCFPYFSNSSCYGKHTCYWGVVKLLKGLSFIPKSRRSLNANRLIANCINFILLHEVCFSSHNNTNFLHKNINKLTFPNMYQSDFLEILWLLKREQVKSININKALDLLGSKMLPNSIWKIERQIKDLVIPIGNYNYGNSFIIKRAKEVLGYYNKK